MQRDYIAVDQAIPMAGLRIALSQGVPGPWGESAKAFFDIKGIDYYPVVQFGGQPNSELQAWTGQNSAPCAVLDEERPRSHWSEILMLAERMQPEPRLVPLDQEERAAMFGIAHELCGEDGFGWSVRLLMLHVIEQSNAGVPLDQMRRKFSNGASLDHAAARASQILDMLAGRIAKQHDRGSDYLVGDVLTAADIYWTCFSNLVAPMAEADCPIPQFYREWAAGCAQLIGRPVPDLLIAHRERILRRHFILPMWF